jgi:hypothetical protein
MGLVTAYSGFASKEVKDAASIPEVAIPFHLHDNRILLNVEINGAGNDSVWSWRTKVFEDLFGIKLWKSKHHRYSHRS